MASPATEPCERASNGRRALALFGGALLAYLVLLAFPLDPRDPTDEHEWTAISIAHFGQVFAGRPPPGAAPGESEWRAGVQATTFGATNPCFAKLVLGSVLWTRGFREIRPEVFQRFAKSDPATAGLARAELEPALPTARTVVRVAAALCAGLVAVVALELGGALAALLAWAAFAFAPLVRTWGGFVRTDFFMLAAALAVVVAALATRDALGGARGRGRRLAAAALIGALSGLALAAKFNGAPSALVAGAALVFAHCAARERRGLGELAAALAVAGGTCLVLVWALDPVLWRHPIDELRAILAFWDEHMRFQQGRAAAQGLATADGPVASLALAGRRLVTRDEPVVAFTGFAYGWLLACAGLWVLAVRARRGSFAARVVLAHVVLFGGVTAAWIPLDWDRYFLPLAALYALLEALAVAALARVSIRAIRKPRSAG